MHSDLMLQKPQVFWIGTLLSFKNKSHQLNLGVGVGGVGVMLAIFQGMTASLVSGRPGLNLAPAVEDSKAG